MLSGFTFVNTNFVHAASMFEDMVEQPNVGGCQAQPWPACSSQAQPLQPEGNDAQPLHTHAYLQGIQVKPQGIQAQPLDHQKGLMGMEPQGLSSHGAMGHMPLGDCQLHAGESSLWHVMLTRHASALGQTVNELYSC